VMVPHHRDFRRAQKLELNYEEWQELSSYSRTRYPGMQIIACVYETKSVDFCETIDVDAYKIHTADLSNPFLVKHVAKKKKRIDLSVGASTLEEIRAAVKWIQSVSKCEIYLMYGLQNFPTPSDDVNLEFMMKLKETLQLPIGYQDHSDAETSSSFWLPAAAIGMGVDILEKHITHDRSLKGADHESALNPDEFKTFVDMVHDVESAKGSAHEKKFSPGQLKYRKYSKKSLVAKHALSAGQMLTENDLSFRASS
jgi:N,N'-diacetyllegionaminate synthase